MAATTAPAPAARVETRILDLTADQALRVETAVDTPYEQWSTVPKGRLYPLVLAELNATADDAKERARLAAEYRTWSLRELQRELIGTPGKP